MHAGWIASGNREEVSAVRVWGVRRREEGGQEHSTRALCQATLDLLADELLCRKTRREILTPENSPSTCGDVLTEVSNSEWIRAQATVPEKFRAREEDVSRASAVGDATAGGTAAGSQGSLCLPGSGCVLSGELLLSGTLNHVPGADLCYPMESLPHPRKA